MWAQKDLGPVRSGWSDEDRDIASAKYYGILPIDAMVSTLNTPHAVV